MPQLPLIRIRNRQQSCACPPVSAICIRPPAREAPKMMRPSRRPDAATRLADVDERHRRTAGQTDLLQLAVGEEAEPAAVRREEGIPGAARRGQAVTRRADRADAGTADSRLRGSGPRDARTVRETALSRAHGHRICRRQAAAVRSVRPVARPGRVSTMSCHTAAIASAPHSAAALHGNSAPAIDGVTRSLVSVPAVTRCGATASLASRGCTGATNR